MLAHNAKETLQLLKVKLLKSKIILEYLYNTYIIMRDFIIERGQLEVRVSNGDMMIKVEVGVIHCWYQNGGRNQKPRNALTPRI